jgi:glycosyltransferase involved in cell wall biosynthesis
MKDTPKRSSLSVIVPVYNSQDVIEDLVNELEKELRLLTDEFELILVNDASIDRSWNIIRLVAEKKSWVRGINLMRNFGQHNALLCGIRAARFDVIVTMDDDMQHPPVGIASLLNELNEGYCVWITTERQPWYLAEYRIICY